MKRSAKLYPIHPFAFGLFPILSLWAANAAQMHIGGICRAVLLTLAVTAGLLGVFGLLSKAWQRVALLLSFWLVAFFSFGKVYEVLLSSLPSGSLLAQANVLLAFWAAALILGSWAIIRKLRVSDELTRLLNIVGVGALVIAVVPAFLAAGQNVQAGQIAQKHRPVEDIASSAAAAQGGVKPDIYYIILDAYGGEDMLRDIYHLDNRPFLDGLRKRGFTVIENAHTNYGRTNLSLASALNFTYLDEMIDLPADSADQTPLEQLINDSAVQQFLKAQGYQTVSFATGFDLADAESADVFIGGQEPLNHFEKTLLTGSLAVFYMDQVSPQFYRDAVHSNFNTLGGLAKQAGPKFVFAHLITPHPPFLFDAQGGPVVSNGWSDGSAYLGGPQDYVERYAAQVQYINTLVARTVDQILAQSATPPVIIIQGDHGPGAYLDWTSFENSCVSERMSILNALYLPGVAAEQIPDNLTPVNTFRIVLNAYFGANLALEDNRSYFMLWEQPYNWQDVTTRVDEACPRAKVKVSP